MNRYPALMGKPDANQPAIIKALISAGASVDVLATGRGVPDLLVGYKSNNFLIEIKTHHGKLNVKQRKWHREFRGTAHIARSPEEALEIIGYRCADLDCKCRSAGL